MKKVKFFSEPISDVSNKQILSSLNEIGITYTYDWSDNLINFYVEIDERKGTKQITRAGDDIRYIDNINGNCVHYCLSDGNFQRGVITELFSKREWILF